MNQRLVLALSMHKGLRGVKNLLKGLAEKILNQINQNKKHYEIHSAFYFIILSFFDPYSVERFGVYKSCFISI